MIALANYSEIVPLVQGQWGLSWQVPYLSPKICSYEASALK